MPRRIPTNLQEHSEKAMNRSTIALLIFVVQAAACCSALGAPLPHPSDTSVSLERGPCERRCAVYGVTLYGDGRVVYVGRYFVRKAGTLKARVNPAAVREIVQQLVALTFFDLKDTYGADPGDCLEQAEDAPRVTLSLTVENHRKIVRHGIGCVGPVTSRLTEIAVAIDRLAGTAQWIK
jgi:hypothetical protein